MASPVDPRTGNEMSYDKALDKIGRRTVAFVIRATDTKPERLIGSGTPAKCGHRYGFVTAAHVEDALPRGAEIGVYCLDGSEKEQKTFFTHSSAKSIGNSPWTDIGPDLSFIQIPDQTASLLKTQHITFIDIDKHGADLKAREDPATKVVSILFAVTAGVVAELSSPGNAMGVCEPGTVSPLSNTSTDIDRLLFTPFKSISYSPPSSYGGNSGGGLWAIVGDEDDPDVLLMGIVYWQQAPSFGHRQIICHGPSALHRALVSQIKALP